MFPSYFSDYTEVVLRHPSAHLTARLRQNKLGTAAYCIADSKALVRHCWARPKEYNSDLLDPERPQYVIISRL